MKKSDLAVVTSSVQIKKSQNTRVSMFKSTLNEIEELKNIKEENKMEEAKKVIEKMKVKKLNSKNELVDIGILEPIDKLQNYGEGMFFYFYFLKFFGVVFSIIALMVIALMVINLHGDGLNLEVAANGLVATTLGNIHRIRYSDDEEAAMKQMTLAQRGAFMSEKSKNTKNIFVVYMVVDMLICLILFVSYFIFQKKVSEYSAIINKINCSIRPYTMLVSGIPETGVTEGSVMEYFEQFGTVVKVSFAYKYQDSLYNMMNIAYYKSKLKGIKAQPKNKKNAMIAKQLVIKMKNEIKIVNKKINVSKLNVNNMESFKILSAFVTFDEASSPSIIAQQFSRVYKRNIWQFLGCSKKIIPEKYVFDGKHKIKFKTPDHPRNIYWENLEYSENSRRIKVLLFIVLSFLILVLSIVINMLLTALATSKTEDCGTSIITKDQMVNAADDQKQKYAYCYCSSLSISTILNDSVNYKYCYPFYLNQIEQRGINFAIAIAVVFINKIIDYINIKLTAYVRYSSKAEVVKKRILFSYIIQYINTAFVSYLIYSEIFGISVVNVFNKFCRKDILKIDAFIVDVDRRWYTIIGPRIISPMIIAMFLPHITDFLIALLYAWLRNRQGRKAPTTSKYIKAMLPPEFAFDLKYSSILKNIFVVLTFGTGMPILYFFLVVIFASAFILHKYTLLRISKLPPLYSSDVVMSVVNLLPFAIILHALFGIYMLSSDDVFPESISWSMGLFSIETSSTNRTFIQSVLHRGLKCLPYSILLGIIIIVFLFENSIFWFCKTYIFAKKIHAANDKIGTYTENYDKIKYFSLPSYNMAIHPQYKRLLKLTLVNYKSIKSFAEGSSLQNLIASTNMLGDKLNRGSLNHLDAIIDADNKATSENCSDLGPSDIESIKADDEISLLEDEAQNPLLYNKKKVAKITVEGKAAHIIKKNGRNAPMPNMNSMEHVYLKANSSSLKNIPKTINEDSEDEEMGIKNMKKNNFKMARN